MGTLPAVALPVNRGWASLAAQPPLCVDLDGTLVRTDTLHEAWLLLCRQSPLAAARALLALPLGVAFFKQQVGAQAALNPATLPYNPELLRYLREQAAAGRRLILATAADRSLAEAVAAHLGLFEAVLASDGECNLKGAAKVAAIRHYLRGAPFEYAGDSRADLPVWQAATRAIVVGRPEYRALLERLGVPVVRQFRDTSRLRAVLASLRAYQWVKNLLVFAPLALHHTLTNGRALAQAALAFAALSAAASAIYIVNDLLDLDADRRHARKRHRPFASGALTARDGCLLIAALLMLAALAAVALPPAARALLAVYVAVTAAYSLALKRMLFLDVTTLAGLYTLRLLYGGAATDVPISFWTLAFSLFLFASLAVCKRLTELARAGAEWERLPGRAYGHRDLIPLAAIGAAGAYTCALVLALYINSPQVAALYRQPQVLWAVCPLLLYWLSRLLLIAYRGHMHDDPIVFAFRDRASRLVALAAAAVVLCAV